MLNNRRNNTETDSLRINLTGSNLRNNVQFEMGIKLMEKLSYMRINKKELNKLKDEECPICISLLTSHTYNNFVVKTDCLHLFHYSCLLKSLFNDSRCPNCRNEIVEKLLEDDFYLV
jgi:hypothetical protein